jgi:hypothetical protein
VSEHEPPFLRRRREDVHERNDAAKAKLERRLLWVEVFTALGIWATLVATAITILDARRVSDRQMRSLLSQQKLMQGQLDTMIAQERPWISAAPRLELPLMRDSTPERMPDLEVPVTVELQNHGASPATNIIIYSMLVPIVASHDSTQLNDAQEELCARAERASNEANKIGIGLFPGEHKAGSGIASIEIAAEGALPLFIMQGCIEYTYGGGLHGQTAYRMYLGHFKADTHLWEGFEWHTDFLRSAPDIGRLLEMKPTTIDFRETDDGGNWAR